MDRLLRARVVVSEAQALGLSVEDLAAVSAVMPSSRSVPTVSEYLALAVPSSPERTQPSWTTPC